MVRNKLDITFANEQEILSLIDSNSFNDVVSFSKKLKKNIVITRGEKGSVAIKDDEIIEYPAKQNLTITDLTGAGDLFAAGYLNGYLNKMPINDCLKQGTELSSEVIQKIGARI